MSDPLLGWPELIVSALLYAAIMGVIDAFRNR